MEGGGDEGRLILVSGATGQQGGAVARNLLERGFSVQQFWESGYEGEIRQGVQLADAARAAGVEHFVYSSVGSAHRETGIPHFDSKWEVEEHVRASGVPYTVLRPVFFM